MKGRKVLVVVTAVVMAMVLLIPFAGATSTDQLTVAQEPTSLDQSLAIAGPDAIVLENWAEYLLGRTTNGELKPALDDHGRPGGFDPSIFPDYFFSKGGPFSIYYKEQADKLIT